VALVVMADDAFRALFDAPRLARLRSLAMVGEPVQVSEVDSVAARARLAAAEVLLTGWGCPPLTASVLDAAPRLRAVLHAAGTVKGHLVDDGCWRRGIRVTSAADANAIPVAEYTLAAILRAGKNVTAFAAGYQSHRGTWQGWRDAIPVVGNLRRTVGLVGLSRVGRRVADLLRPFDLDVLAYDPYVSAFPGVTLVGLDDLLARSEILSLHAPAVPQTRHLLNAARLALLPDGATVVNTARGSLVDTDALAAECVAGRLSAILDVTEPEPLPADSPLWGLSNVELTPHVAGAMGTEVRRLADAALEELARYVAGEPALHPVLAADLDHTA
jgi:phosphoglycerate dehydrogenase-like enzyme